MNSQSKRGTDNPGVGGVVESIPFSERRIYVKQPIGLERFDWTDSIGPIRLHGGVQRGGGDGRRRGGDGAATGGTAAKRQHGARDG